MTPLQLVAVFGAIGAAVSAAFHYHDKNYSSARGWATAAIWALLYALGATG